MAGNTVEPSRGDRACYLHRAPGGAVLWALCQYYRPDAGRAGALAKAVAGAAGPAGPSRALVLGSQLAPRLGGGVDEGEEEEGEPPRVLVGDTDASSASRCARRAKASASTGTFFVHFFTRARSHPSDLSPRLFGRVCDFTRTQQTRTHTSRRPAPGSARLPPGFVVGGVAAAAMSHVRQCHATRPPSPSSRFLHFSSASVSSSRPSLPAPSLATFATFATCIRAARARSSRSGASPLASPWRSRPSHPTPRAPPARRSRCSRPRSTRPC